MPQIWQDPETFRQQAGQLWAQGMHQQLEAGENWAQNAMQAAIAPAQDAVSKLQAMVPQVPTSAPTPIPSPTPTPAPAPQPTPTPPPAPPPSVAPEPTPSAALPTAPLPTAAPPPPAPTPTPTQIGMAPSPQPATTPDAGQNWAQQQIANLLNPSAPSPTPAPTSAETAPSAAPAETAPTTPGGTPLSSTSGGSQHVLQWSDQINAAAAKYGVPAAVIAGVIDHESGGQADAGVSNHPGGALGLMQIEPETWAGLGMGGPNGRLDPATNIDGGTKLLSQLKASYGNWDDALKAYYWPAGLKTPDAPGPGGQPSVNVIHDQFIADINKYGGIASDALGGATGSPGSGAPINTPQQGAQAVTARQGMPAAVEPQRQFETEAGLGTSDAYTACGPVAAAAFAQTYGRNPSPTEALALAREVGWTPDQGMAGPGSEVQLLNKMGVDAHMTSGVDWNQVQSSAASGNPVILSTPNHYLYVDGYNGQTGEYHVGASGSALRGGSEWMTSAQIASVPGTHGPAQAAIFVDHPIDGSGVAPGAATGTGGVTGGAGSSGLLPSGVGTGAVGAGLTTGTGGATGGAGSRGLLPSATTGIQNLIGSGQDLSSQLLQQQVASIQGAVQNVGSSSLNLLNQGAQLLQQAPQTVEDRLQQNTLLSQGLPTLATQATTSLPGYLQSLAGGAADTGVGRGLQAGAQVLGQEQEDLFNRPSVLDDLQKNEDALRRGDVGDYLRGSFTLASRVAQQAPGAQTALGPIAIANTLGGLLTGTGGLPLYQQNPLEMGDISQPVSAALTAGGIDPEAARVLGQVANFVTPMALEHGLPRIGGAGELGGLQLAPGEIAQAAPDAGRLGQFLDPYRGGATFVPSGLGDMLSFPGLGVVGRSTAQAAGQAPLVHFGMTGAIADDARAAYNRLPTAAELQDAQATLDALTQRGGQTIGLPSNITGAEDLARLRNQLASLAQAGISQKEWYANSSQAIMDAAGGNKQDAEKIAQLVAIYSPQTQVNDNLNRALMAWYQHQNGEPIKVATGDIDQRASDLLYNGQVWEGRKTNNFYRNLMQVIDPDVYKSLGTGGKTGSTQDIWMAQAFNLPGEGRVVNGQSFSKAPTNAQYSFMADETAKLADQLGWTPEQVQAAIWSSVKAGSEGKTVDAAGFHYGNALDQRQALMPGGAAPEVEAAFQDPRGGGDQLARELGVVGGTSTEQPGAIAFGPQARQSRAATAEEIAAGSAPDGPLTRSKNPRTGEWDYRVNLTENQGRVQGDARDALNAYAAARGVLLQLPVAGWVRMFAAPSVKASTAAIVDAGRSFAPDEIEALDQALAGSLGADDLHAVQPSPTGAWVLNLGDTPGARFQNAVDTALQQVQSLPAEVSRLPARFDSETFANDWSANPNGESYRAAIDNAGRAAQFAGVEPDLAARIAAAAPGAGPATVGGYDPAALAAQAQRALAALGPTSPLAGRAFLPGALGRSALLQSLGLGGLYGGLAGGYQASQEPGATPADILGGAARGVPIGMAEGLARRYSPEITPTMASLGARPGQSISLGDWIRAAYRGGIVSSLQTAADVAFNSTLTPILTGGAGLARDAAAFAPDRAAGRMLGAQSGMANWGGNFLRGLSDSFNRPSSVTARAAPGVAGVLAHGFEGMGAIHGAFQNATSELLAAMETGARAGETASSRTAGTWFNAFDAAFHGPQTAETIARAQGVGQRAAARSELGTLTGALGRAVTGMGPVGDALFPVYRMGMNWASRLVESTPAGLAGTVFDVGRGMAGQGPYADIATRGLRNAFDVIPTARGGIPGQAAAVGPLGERLANNLIGTALTLWLANQALAGNVTGSGPTDPDERRLWLAKGIQPDSFRVPGTDQYRSWDRLPPQLKGPMMAAGAYADAQQAATKAQARADLAGPDVYGVEDPRWAAANQLLTEVGHQLAAATPLRTFANIYDTLAGGGGAGTAALQGASDIASSVAGGAVPESGLVRSIAQMTDPYARAPLVARLPQELPQAISERVQENIPGLRGNLPVPPDVLGRPTLNPLAGLQGLIPTRAAAGQPSAILDALQNAGASVAGPPPSVAVGPSMQVALNPAEQRTWTQLRGQLLQQIAGQMVADPTFQASPPNVQRIILERGAQAATEAANRQMLGVLPPEALQVGSPHSRLEPRSGSVLAPSVGYGPDVTTNQLMLQQQLRTLQAQALLNSLGAGPSSGQQLAAMNAQQR